MTFGKIVDMCVKHGFFRRLVYPKLNREVLKVESTGALLLENLRSEWYNSLVINKDISAFVAAHDFSETFDFAKAICLDRAPFAVAQFLPRRPQSVMKMAERKPEDGLDFGDFFEEGLILKCWVFVVPAEATQFFHQWQRQRRMWWRKWSASPGRYTLTDTRTEAGGQSLDILAQYKWGQQLVESLRLDKGPKGITQDQLQVKYGKKTVQVQCISSETCLSTMLLNAVCDAYDEPLFQDNPRPILRLHRKIAPYKLSFSIPSGSKATVDELKDLALYLCRQLRANQVSCLLLPSGHKHTLESQWKQYDQTGVPFNVILNENTLKNGIALLRSRETTLKEEVHVANLVSYVEQLFKNF